jgi:sporulation protein YlmC with PRC-barrel domain
MLAFMRSTSQTSYVQRASTYLAARPVGIIGVDELLESPVVDRDGGRIGRLHDLMVDLRLGRIAYALVELERVESAEERLIAVPWNAMHVDGTGNLKVNAHRDRVERGPSIPAGMLAHLLDHEWAVFIHAYFGARPYWEHGAQHG